MTKFLILGCDGQLGSELRAQLDRAQMDGEQVSYAVGDVDDCDITDEQMLVDCFERHADVDVVFNAAAYTDVDAAEEEPNYASLVNTIGAGHVASACRDIGAKLIHFSTDFVFGDEHNCAGPLDERVEPTPLSVYGETKLAGEHLALQNNPATAVLRSSGLYSHWAPNFVSTIARHAQQKDSLTIVNDQFVSPTPVTTLSKVALNVAESPLFPGGVYHASSRRGCTWYEFGRRIIQLLDLDVEVEPTTAEAWGAAARRPRYCVLENRRLRLRGLDEFDDWDAELEAFLEEHGGKILER